MTLATKQSSASAAHHGELQQATAVERLEAQLRRQGELQAELDGARSRLDLNAVELGRLKASPEAKSKDLAAVRSAISEDEQTVRESTAALEIVATEIARLKPVANAEKLAVAQDALAAAREEYVAATYEAEAEMIAAVRALGARFVTMGRRLNDLEQRFVECAREEAALRTGDWHLTNDAHREASVFFNPFGVGEPAAIRAHEFGALRRWLYHSATRNDPPGRQSAD